jgi:hypothetical protein
MKEEFLHYLWKYGLYDKDLLLDSEGNKIVVINPGTYNRDSGPDFFNARILIGGTLWAGNVEIHNLASTFNVHGHQYDAAYNNVILHVVAVNDCRIYNEKGQEICTTVLKFDPGIYSRYEALISNPCRIACQDEISKTESVRVYQWLSSLSIERLEKKTTSIEDILRQTGNDWEETLYIIISRYFGFRVNREPFEMLAKTLPVKVIRKHSDNLFQIEALLFGAAGMLEEGLFKDAVADEYYFSLLKEFKILQSKYSIQPAHGWLWKFSRLRPVNFPTLRISQLASMLSVSGGLFSRVLECRGIDELRRLFDVSASEYWEDHYVFGRKCRRTTRNAGSQATDILIINAIVPLIFVYGKNRSREDICERAILFLENTKAENNVITREWERLGVKVGNAFYSQALIELKNEYCLKRRCLHCRIGNYLISRGSKLKADEDLMLEPGVPARRLNE